ncbi:MAG: helix-turn-helix domain-containing protein [Tagaea sp.]|nr:helix-turn-helix domain-containing protein [Tagaea sp.]
MRPRPVDDIPDELPLDRHVTIAKAAEALGCDESTVRKMLKNGDLQGFRVRADRAARGAPRVSVASIERYVAGMRIVPKAAIAKREDKTAGRALTNAHRAAVAELRRLGIV